MQWPQLPTAGSCQHFNMARLAHAAMAAWPPFIKIIVVFVIMLLINP
jgi:hypothetical protein